MFDHCLLLPTRHYFLYAVTVPGSNINSMCWIRGNIDKDYISKVKIQFDKFKKIACLVQSMPNPLFFFYYTGSLTNILNAKHSGKLISLHSVIRNQYQLNTCGIWQEILELISDEENWSRIQRFVQMSGLECFNSHSSITMEQNYKIAQCLALSQMPYKWLSLSSANSISIVIGGLSTDSCWE